MRDQVDISLGDLGNLDLSTLRQFSADVSFPASRKEVGSSAESNNAPQELVQKIRSGSAKRSNSPDEVLQAVQGACGDAAFL